MNETAPPTPPAAQSPARPLPRLDESTLEPIRRRVDAGAPAPGSWPTDGSVPVSVLIPVKNESANIVECIRRVRWATQIAVIDSGSDDDTVALSQAMGAEVYRFDYARHSPGGWPKKKNWALEHVPWANEWVLIFDADEHATPELTREIAGVVNGTHTPPRNGCGDGYWINRKLIFLGRWIKGCGYYPSWNVRLFKHAVGRYERMASSGDTGTGDNEVHEHVVLSTGEAGWLEQDFLHYAYADIAQWVEKHNRYSTWEAKVQRLGELGRDGDAGHSGHSSAANIEPRLLGNRTQRRRWIKKASLRMPFRPTLRFLYHYVVARGFRDGYPGYVLCRLMAVYEFLSVAKHYELKQAERPEPVEPR
ncbi:MAG: glycosyltransferase family 2 protein [Planctomycetota bacterium]